MASEDYLKECINKLQHPNTEEMFREYARLVIRENGKAAMDLLPILTENT